MDAAVEKPKHVHVDTSQRDCDGLMDHSHIETRDIFSLVGHAIGVTEQGAFAKVEIDSNDDHWRVNITKPTEEGFYSCYMYECGDNCDVEKTSQRDHAAEAAGY